jgi:uncharacterized protein (TIGR00106 family)
MKATGEIQVIPIGSGVSVREEVRHAHRVIEASGLRAELHASGTNVEGELADILDVVRQIHEQLHDTGTRRLATYIKIGTRTDKIPTLAGKLF